MEDLVDPTALAVHSITLLLFYSYVKQDLTFPFLWVLTPSILILAIQGYQSCKGHSGLRRAKYIITGILLLLFMLTFAKAIKNQGGMSGEMDDSKWLVKHRKCFELLLMACLTYSFLSFIDPERQSQKSLAKDVMLNIFSSLSMPLTICSGGACNSIYISTVTSILSSFSVPLTMVIPFLNVIGYVLQVVGLFSLYSANKWKSYPFWLYLGGMLSQVLIHPWLGITMMIVAVVANARVNKFVYGRKLFKQSIV